MLFLFHLDLGSIDGCKDSFSSLIDNPRRRARTVVEVFKVQGNAVDVRPGPALRKGVTPNGTNIADDVTDVLIF